MGDIDASWCPLGWVSPEIPGGAGDNVIHYYFIPKPQMQMVYSSFFLLKALELLSSLALEEVFDFWIRQ